MARKDHQQSEERARKARLQRDRRHHTERQEGWGREDFLRDLKRVTKRSEDGDRKQGQGSA